VSVTFYFGGGGDAIDHEIISDLQTICPHIRPHFFISAAAVIGSSGLPKGRELFLTDDQERLGLDSGGNGLATCKTWVGDLPAKKVARFYIDNLNEGAICFSPDLPLRNLESHYSLHASFARYSEFYQSLLRKKKKLKVYGVVQGDCKQRGQYTPKERLEWFDLCRQRHGHQTYGYAFRPPEFKRTNIIALAYFMMMGWVRGEPHVHGLAMGSIPKLILLAYIGSRAYLRLTCDATSYLISARANGQTVVPINGRFGRLIAIKKMKDRQVEAVNSCGCRVCNHYRSSTKSDLITYFRRALDKVPGFSLDIATKWQCSHNICLVQEAVDSINRMTASSLGVFNENILAEYPILKGKTKNDLLKAADLVDQILKNGTDEYETKSLNDLRALVNK